MKFCKEVLNFRIPSQPATDVHYPPHISKNKERFVIVVTLILGFYPSLISATQGFFCYFFFRRILGQPIDFKRNWHIPIFLSAGYSFFTHFASETLGKTFTTATGVLLASVFLKELTKTKFIQTVYVIFISFLLNTVIFAMSVSISGFVVYISIGRNDDIADIVALPLAIFVNIIICNLKLMKKDFSFLFERDNRFRPPLAIILFAVLMLHVTTQEMYNSGIDAIEYRSVYLAFCVFIIGVAGFFFYYLRMAIKENNEKTELVKHNKFLANERHDTISWINELKTELLSVSSEFAAEIVGDFEDLVATGHDWHRELSFPTTGNRTVDAFLNRCRENFSKHEIDVHVLIRDKLKMKGPQVISLVSVIHNFTENAFKILMETEREDKQITVEFAVNGETGIYEIKIFDNGKGFNETVLKNLGRENNTTNGTGKGFPNNINHLLRLGASLTVNEFGYDAAKNIPTTCMVIKFDRKNEFFVESYNFGKFEIFTEKRELATIS